MFGMNKIVAREQSNTLYLGLFELSSVGIYLGYWHTTVLELNKLYNMLKRSCMRINRDKKQLGWLSAVFFTSMVLFFFFLVKGCLIESLGKLKHWSMIISFFFFYCANWVRFNKLKLSFLLPIWIEVLAVWLIM